MACQSKATDDQHKFQIFNRHTKVGVEVYDLFLLTAWLERLFSYFAISLEFDFSEILDVFSDYVVFHSSTHLRK